MAPLPFLLCSLFQDDLIQTCDLNHYLRTKDSQIAFSRSGLFLNFRSIFSCFLGIPTGNLAKFQINTISTKYACLSIFPILVNGMSFYTVVQKNLGVSLNFSVTYYCPFNCQHPISKTSRFYLLKCF